MGEFYNAVLAFLRILTEGRRTNPLTLITPFTFDNIAQSTESNWYDTRLYRYILFYFKMSKTGAGTANIQLFIDFTDDDGVPTDIYTVETDMWAEMKYTIDMIGTGRNPFLKYKGLGKRFRLRVVATSTTAINTITFRAKAEMGTL